MYPDQSDSLQKTDAIESIQDEDRRHCLVPWNTVMHGWMFLAFILIGLSLFSEVGSVLLGITFLFLCSAPFVVAMRRPRWWGAVGGLLALIGGFRGFAEMFNPFADGDGSGWLLSLLVLIVGVGVLAGTVAGWLVLYSAATIDTYDDVDRADEHAGPRSG